MNWVDTFFFAQYIILYLARDHWWGLNTRDALIVHTDESFQFQNQMYPSYAAVSSFITSWFFLVPFKIHSFLYFISLTQYIATLFSFLENAMLSRGSVSPIDDRQHGSGLNDHYHSARKDVPEAYNYSEVFILNIYDY